MVLNEAIQKRYIAFANVVSMTPRACAGIARSCPGPGSARVPLERVPPGPGPGAGPKNIYYIYIYIYIYIPGVDESSGRNSTTFLHEIVFRADFVFSKIGGNIKCLQMLAKKDISQKGMSAFYKQMRQDRNAVSGAWGYKSS